MNTISRWFADAMSDMPIDRAEQQDSRSRPSLPCRGCRSAATAQMTREVKPNRNSRRKMVKLSKIEHAAENARADVGAGAGIVIAGIGCATGKLQTQTPDGHAPGANQLRWTRSKRLNRRSTSRRTMATHRIDFRRKKAIRRAVHKLRRGRF